MKAPDVIYLQWHGDAPTTRLDDDDNEIPLTEEEMGLAYTPDPDDVTWCVDRIYDADIPYRRVTTCVWRWTGVYWETSCDAEGFVIKGETPEQSDFHHCPYCTGRIEVST